MQAVIRHLVFEEAGVDSLTEIRKDQTLPPGPSYSLVCLDGFDFLQRLKRAALAAHKAGGGDAEFEALYTFIRRELCRRTGDDMANFRTQAKAALLERRTCCSCVC